MGVANLIGPGIAFASGAAKGLEPAGRALSRRRDVVRAGNHSGTAGDESEVEILGLNDW